MSRMQSAMGLIKGPDSDFLSISSPVNFTASYNYRDHLIYDGTLYVLQWNSASSLAQIQRIDVSTSTPSNIGTTTITGAAEVVSLERIGTQLFILGNGELSYCDIVNPTTLTYQTTYADASLAFLLTSSTGGTLIADGTDLYAVCNFDALHGRIVKLDISSISTTLTVVDTLLMPGGTDTLIGTNAFIYNGYLYSLWRESTSIPRLYVVYGVELSTFSSISTVTSTTLFTSASTTATYRLEDINGICYFVPITATTPSPGYRFFGSSGAAINYATFTLNSSNPLYGLGAYNNRGYFFRRVGTTIIEVAIYSGTTLLDSRLLSISSASSSSPTAIDRNNGYIILITLTQMYILTVSGSY